VIDVDLRDLTMTTPSLQSIRSILPSFNIDSDVFVQSEVFNQLITQAVSLLSDKGDNNRMKVVYDMIIDIFFKFAYRIETKPEYVFSLIKLFINFASFMEFKCKEKNIIRFLFLCARVSSKLPKIIPYFEPMFSHLFFKDQFFSQFVAMNGYETLFSYLFIEYPNYELTQTLFSLLFDPSYSFKGLKIAGFLEFFDSCVKSKKILLEFHFFALLYTSKLVNSCSRVLKNVSSFFIAISSDSFISMLEKLPNDMKSECLIHLLSSNNDDCSQSPNLNVFSLISKTYFVNLNIKKIAISSTINFVKYNSKIINQLNAIYPVILWIADCDLNSDSICSFMELVDQEIPEFISSVIPSVIRAFKKCEPKFNDILQIYQIIMKYLDRSAINLSFLTKEMFLESLLCSLPANDIYRFFNESQSFSSICIDLFNQIESSNQRVFVFSQLSSVIPFFEKADVFIRIFSSLLITKPVTEFFRILIRILSTIKEEKYLWVFQTVFFNSSICCKQFIEACGIEWLFTSEFVSITTIIGILSSLVRHEIHTQLDMYIFSLLPTHPLFQQPKAVLENIVYGLNISPYRQIRVPSLVTYINPIKNLDPYNSWVLGKYYVEGFLASHQEIFSCPMIDQICNRYIEPQFISLLMQKPYMLEPFCNVLLDHFPLFQFFPGHGSLRIDQSFVGVSFWFKFSSSNQASSDFFESDSIYITMSGEDLIISSGLIENTIHISPTNWNFLSIQIESNLISTDIKVVINTDTIRLPLMSKSKSFMFASFSSFANNILYLGPAIRFFSESLISVSDYYKLGPGFTDQLPNLSNDFIFTPGLINSNEINKFSFSCPECCVPVPYFGLPIHFISMAAIRKLIFAMEESSNYEAFRNVFVTLVNIHSITLSDSKEFWMHLLKSMMKCRSFLNKNLFILALKSVSEQQNCSTILQSILFNTEMWHYAPGVFSNNDVINSLFEYFSKDQLMEIEFFELFLAKLVIENPKSKDIVSSILNNLNKTINTMKYLVSILKTGLLIHQQCCSWDAIVYLEGSDIQYTIIDSIIEFLNPNTVEIVSKAISCSEIRSLMLISPRQLAQKYFQLISSIARLNPEYFMCDYSILIQIATLSYNTKTWIDSLSIMSSQQSANVFIPIGLVLIFSGSLLQHHIMAFSIPRKDLYDQISLRLETIIEMISGNYRTIYSSDLCTGILYGLYPLVFHYSSLFGKVFDVQPLIPDPSLSILSKNILPEANEKIWIGSTRILSNFGFPQPNKPSSPHHFLLETITSLFTNCGFQIPFSDSEYSAKNVTEWFTSSSLLSFLTDLLLFSPKEHFTQILNSLLFSFDGQYYNRQDPFIPILIHSLLSRIPHVYSQSIPFEELFRIVLALTGLQFFSDSSLVILSDIFAVMRAIQSKGNDEMMRCLFPISDLIMFRLFNQVTSDQYDHAFSLFHNYSNLFLLITSFCSSMKSWLYSFIHPSKNRLTFEFFSKLLLRDGSLNNIERTTLDSLYKHTFSSSSSNYCLLEDEWKVRSHSFQIQYQEVLNSIRSKPSYMVINAGELSVTIHKEIHISRVRLYLLSQLFSASLRYVSSYFLLMEEKSYWIMFLAILKDKGSNIYSFSSLSYHLAPYSFPFTPSKVLSSNFLNQKDEGRDRYYNSIPIKMYKSNVHFTKSKTHDLQMNLLNMYLNTKKTKHGKALSICNCSLIRYSNQINCVMLMFYDAIFLLTYSLLNEDQDDFEILPITDPKAFHVFLEEIYLGLWGKSSLFASRVIIKVKFKNLVSVQMISDIEYGFWSFNNGNFLLRFDKSIVSSLKDKFSKIADVSVSLLPPIKLLNSIRSSTDASEEWNKGKLSNSRFLLLINSKNGRTFEDFANYPVFPDINDIANHIYDNTIFLDLVYNTLKVTYPFAYYIDIFKQNVSRCKDSFPALVYYSHDIFHQQSLKSLKYQMLRSIDSNENRTKITKWICSTFKQDDINDNFQPLDQFIDVANVSNILIYQKIDQVYDASFSYHFEKDYIVIMPGISSMVYSQSTYSVLIDKHLSVLKIIDIERKECIYTLVDHFIPYSHQIHVSNNGLFISIDFSFGYSLVYRIFYHNKIPTHIEKISSFSWDGIPETYISGIDWICVTKLANKVVIWQINTSMINWVIDYSDTINAFCIDEPSFTLWVATGNYLEMRTLNSTLISKIEVDFTISSIQSIPNPSVRNNRSILVGTKSGSLYIASPDYDGDTIVFKQIISPHQNCIKMFSYHPSLKAFMSIDEAKNIYFWTGYQINSPKLRLSVFSHCPFCKNPASIHCSMCSRGICSVCTIKESPVLCPHCFALKSYFQ